MCKQQKLFKRVQVLAQQLSGEDEQYGASWYDEERLLALVAKLEAALALELAYRQAMSTHAPGFSQICAMQQNPPAWYSQALEQHRQAMQLFYF